MPERGFFKRLRLFLAGVREGGKFTLEAKWDYFRIIKFTFVVFSSNGPSRRGLSQLLQGLDEFPMFLFNQIVPRRKVFFRHEGPPVFGDCDAVFPGLRISPLIFFRPAAS